MAERIGQQFGNYRLAQLLGKGGFADTYLGEHIHLKTFAAIKVLQTLLGQPETEAFHNEAHIIARLNHPHIIHILEFEMENHTPYIIMEYAPNGTLRQRCPRGSRLSPTTVLTYVKQIAAALQYAHQKSWFTAMSNRRICCWDVTAKCYSAILGWQSLLRLRRRISKISPGP